MKLVPVKLWIFSIEKKPGFLKTKHKTLSETQKT